MELDALWSSILTGGLGFLIWWVKSQHDELKRISILLNKTREELAKEYSTKIESNASIDRVLARLDALDSKIDRILEAK
jgi:hypothetical protein|tara:strand:- start:421 stop:657 length:237 start_codon:yes stop_codon:yes gene_type:complete